MNKDHKKSKGIPRNPASKSNVPPRPDKMLPVPEREQLPTTEPKLLPDPPPVNLDSGVELPAPPKIEWKDKNE